MRTSVNVYTAAASGSVMSLILSMGPNPAWDAHINVSFFAFSDHTAGTVRIYSIGVSSTNSMNLLGQSEQLS